MNYSKLLLLAGAASVVLLGILLIRSASPSRAATPAGRSDPLAAEGRPGGGEEQFPSGSVGSGARTPEGESPGSLVGRVVLEGSEEGVPSLDVTLVSAGSPDLGGVVRVTDSKGAFEFGPLSPGEYSVVVAPPSPYRRHESDVAILAGRESELLIAISAGLTLEVSVVNDTTGEAATPIARAVVECFTLEDWRDPGGEGPASPLQAATTDDAGLASIEGIPAGEYVLRASAPGHVEQHQVLDLELDRREELEPEPRRGVLMRLTRGGPEIEGVILGPAGQALAQCLICLGPDPRNAVDSRFKRSSGSRRSPAAQSSPPFALTDSAGRFRLRAPVGQEGAMVLVCPRDPALPPVHWIMVPLKNAALRTHTIRIPEFPRVELDFVLEGGGLPEGRADVEDSRFSYLRLAEDPVLSRIPGFEEWIGGVVTTGRVDLRLRPGSYRVFWTMGGVRYPFGITVEPDGNVNETFVVSHE